MLDWRLFLEPDDKRDWELPRRWIWDARRLVSRSTDEQVAEVLAAKDIAWRRQNLLGIKHAKQVLRRRAVHPRQIEHIWQI